MDAHRIHSRQALSTCLSMNYRLIPFSQTLLSQLTRSSFRPMNALSFPIWQGLVDIPWLSRQSLSTLEGHRWTDLLLPLFLA